MADGVALVILAAEQRTQLEVVKPTGQRLHRFADLRLEAVVASLDGHLYEGLGLLDALCQTGMQIQVLDHGRQVLLDTPAAILVVPELGVGHFDLQGRPAFLLFGNS